MAVHDESVDRDIRIAGPWARAFFKGRFKGGAGSGHHGHGGRPGRRGGSAGGGTPTTGPGSQSLAGTQTFWGKPKPKPATAPLGGAGIQTEEEAGEWAGKHFASWRDGLSDDQVISLEDYSGGEYEPINDSLRGFAGIESATGEAVGIISSTMTSLPEDVVVHRKIDYDLEGKAGSRFVDKGFVSTAVSESYSQEMLDEGGGVGTMVRIEVPKGTKVAYLGSIGDTEAISYVPGETELLLDRGLRFEIKTTRGTPVLRVVP